MATDELAEAWLARQVGVTRAELRDALDGQEVRRLTDHAVLIGSDHVVKILTLEAHDG